MRNLLIGLLLLFPLSSAQADFLGFDSKLNGEYNIDTNKSSVSGEIGKTIGVYGFSITSDIDFDLINFTYEGMDIKTQYSLGTATSMEVYLKSGLDTNWTREDVVVGLEVKF